MSVVPVDAQEQKAFRDKMSDKAIDKATSIISGKKDGGLFGGGLFGGGKKKSPAAAVFSQRSKKRKVRSIKQKNSFPLLNHQSMYTETN